MNISRSYGAGRYESNYEDKMMDYPIGYVRWTENRNMETIVKLISERKLSFRDLNYEKFSFSNCISVFTDLESGNNAWTSGLIEYDIPQKVKIGGKKRFRYDSKTNDKIRVGVIGAGNYAQNIILPIMKKSLDYKLVGLSSNSGSTVSHIGKIFWIRILNY